MFEFEFLRSATIFGTFVLLLWCLKLFADRVYVGIPTGWRGTMLRIGFSTVLGFLLLFPVFVWLQGGKAKNTQHRAEQRRYLSSLEKAFLERLAAADTAVQELTLAQQRQLSNDRQQLAEIIDLLLDLHLTLMNNRARGRGDWHLGILAPSRGERDQEDRLRIIAASRVLRNNDAINFSMAPGEGVGGRMWEEWIESGAPATSGLKDADQKGSYLKSALLPPKQLRLSSDVSTCGICVMIPRSDFHPPQSFPGILCLGSNHPRDFAYFKTQNCEAELFELAADLSGFVGKLAKINAELTKADNGR
jgi:hypothetical protein